MMPTLTSWTTVLDAPSVDQQRSWLAALRPRLKALVLVSNDGELAPAVAEQLAGWLESITVGAPAGCGYARPRPGASCHRYRYDRRLLAVLDQWGGPMADSAAQPFTALGDVDLVLVGERDQVLGATIAHERLVIAAV